MDNLWHEKKKENMGGLDAAEAAACLAAQNAKQKARKRHRGKERNKNREPESWCMLLRPSQKENTSGVKYNMMTTIRE